MNLELSFIYKSIIFLDSQNHGKWLYHWKDFLTVVAADICLQISTEPKGSLNEGIPSQSSRDVP